MTQVTRPVLRYHGGKFRLADWVMGFFPEHTCYVEPFGGAAGVLLQKPRAYAEVYNDLDGDVVNFFRVLRDPELKARLIEACALTPYARADFEQAWEPADEPIERARRLAIRAQMGFGSAGATKGVTGFRIDTKREYGTAQQLWALYPAALSEAGQRLQGVLVENRPAIDVMRQHDAPQTLHFVDPPYLHGTRVMNKGERYYRHEMSDDQHKELLAAVLELEGMVVLSGYPSEMYDSALSTWDRHEKAARISAGRGTATRTEVVWINQACAAALDCWSVPAEAERQVSLFEVLE
ncbi:DNA adenine methylase [Cupriavidus sp. CV2]|uniref:DNA adenine methylase n=1 Tax=Cupriavidus ulmosensis TaxID=3065913 RepID=UPI00296B4248|nr:DNA adenine methylase [Cupriavidus sp. CV2]MDW3683923.1 DNA adenine methylase [Cupriavidus sp. CV2]